MRGKTVMTFAGMVLAAAALTGCGSKPVLGILLPQTGDAQPYADSMKKAMDLALEDAKKAGRQPAGLEVYWEDSGSNPEQAAAAAEKLISQHGAKLLLAGVTSGEAKALLPILDATKTACISPSASAPLLTKRSKYFYRIFPSDELEGSTAARFLKDDMTRSTVLIYTEDTEHSRGIEPEFRQVYEQVLQGKVVGRVLLNDPDWKKESADILAAENPEAVYIIAYAQPTLQVLEHLNQQRYRGTTLATSAFYNGELITKNAKLVDNVFFPQPAFDVEDNRPVVQTFVKEFRDRYKEDPDIYAAHAYDGLGLALEVLKKTKPLEGPEIKKTLQFGIQGYVGVTGTIQFDDYGDVRHNPIMYIIKDGKVYNYKRYVKRILDDLRRRMRRPS